MASAASLMVRIGADVEDFARGMTKAEKSAKRGFDTIRDAGEKLSMGITAPFLVMAGAVAKMAADAEDASARVDRVFGAMAANVKQQLKDLAGVVPETDEALQQMAVKSDNMLQGLGYGAEKAARLSVSMVKLAGDMAAFAHVPVGEALDALDKGLAGKTRGLIQFGIVVSAQQIKLEAMRRGLLDNHRTLTELGTAEISEMLIRKAATRITGEAERTAGQAANTFKFLKRDVEELGDKIGSFLLPSVAALARGMREMVDGVSRVPPDLIKFALAGTAAAAAVGPLLVSIANLAKALTILRAAYAAATGIGALGTIFGAIAAAPFAAIVGGVAAVTTALYGYYRAWRLFSGKDAEDEQNAEDAANDATKTVLRNARHARLKKKAPAKDGPLNQDSRDALNIFKDHAALVQDQYQNAVEVGGSLVERMAAINALHSEAVGLLASQNGQWTDMAKAAADVARQTQLINDVVSVAGALARGTATPQLLGDASRNATSPTAIALSLANKAIGDETSLRTREAALRIQDTFNATREAVIQFGEEIRNTRNDLALRRAKLALPSTYNAAEEEGVNAIERMRAMYKDLADRAERVKTGTMWDDPGANARVQLDEERLAATRETSLRFEKLLAPFDAFRDKLGNVSGAMQVAAVTIFDAAVNLAQSLAQQLAGKGKGAGIGGMLGSLLGGTLAGAKFGAIFGPLGAALGGIAGALAGSLFDHPAKAADQASTALTGLTLATEQVTQQLLNVPQGFKVALAQWRAQLPQSYPATPSGNSGGGGSRATPRAQSQAETPIVLVLDGRVVAQSTLKAFRTAAQGAYADSTRWPDLMAI